MQEEREEREDRRPEMRCYLVKDDYACLHSKPAVTFHHHPRKRKFDLEIET